ncbi:MAG: ammonium transporter [Clostridia bacterium]|nr:ammonium transporter [Clostridia bacterium]
MTRGFLATALSLLAPAAAWAAEEVPAIDTGDTTFILISAALVMLMVPGVALLYGGMSARNNVLNTIMLAFICLCVVSVQWVLFGYSLAFGPDVGKFVGSLNWLGLNGVGLEPNPDYSATIPHQTFMVFQLMFAAVTPAVMIGAFAERIRFPAFLLFLILWTTLIYDPLAHWVWGGGWLSVLGAVDFAGGMVVHIASGVGGLVVVLVVGGRKGFGTKPMTPHHLPMVFLGLGMLWFGWFGFNAGSALSAGGLATNAFVVTNTAAAAGALAWMVTEWLRQGKPTVLGAISGCIAGLGSITPAAGFVTAVSAIGIGLVGGVACYFAVSVLKHALKYDDALDAFGIHGVAGTWGSLSVGLFATTAVNPDGVTGLFYGNAAQLGAQAIGVVATWVFVGVGTFILIKLVGLFMPLRVSEADEDVGLDVTQHGESGYSDDLSFGVLPGSKAALAGVREA